MFLISAYLIQANRNALVLRGISAVSLEPDIPADAQHDDRQTERDDRAQTMTTSQPAPQNPKISAEFAARLQRLEPDDPVRVIVLAARPHMEPGSCDARDSIHDGVDEAAAIQRALEDPFVAVDRCLAGTGGRRLTERPNTLGHIVVETTPRGIEALCGLPVVRVIFEDQPIHPHPPVAYPE